MTGHDTQRCANPRCKGGWVDRGDNESGAAPAFPCRTEGCPYAVADGAGHDTRVGPYTDDDFDDEGFVLTCTHCSGEGTCDDNANPSWDCDENPHPCHACGGSGDRHDQRIF